MQKTVIASLGHHKCASSFFWALIKNMAAAFGVESRYYSNAPAFGREFPSLIAERDVFAFALANAQRSFLPDLEGFRALHVIRDPRDMVVSGYFSHLYSHSTEGWAALEGYREKLKRADKKSGLILEMDFFEEVFGHMTDWNYKDPRMLELTFEGYLLEPEETWRRTLDFLLKPAAVDSAAEGAGGRYSLAGVTRSASDLEQIRDRRSFESLSGGRAAGEENQHHHYRKGIAGDWKNHFDADLRETFAKRFNDVLITLGYEEDDAWVTK